MMPRQQPVKQQAQDAVKHASETAQQAGGQAEAAASNAAHQARDKAAGAQEKVTDAASSVKSTMQSYAQEGQRAATEQMSNMQEGAKKAMDTAHTYIEGARKKADPYMESAKAKYEAAKEAAGNVRESAHQAMENAKGQVNAVRERVSVKTQPYVDNVQNFDITKTAAFHVFTHLISIILYVMWRVMQMVPGANNVVKVIQEKNKEAGVVDGCAALVEKVPAVGPRMVEVASTAAKSIRTDLNEQIAQYESISKKQK
jgi:ElaB/YqjD/DUF883 family membrane-anchored ribosome-binding protein